MDIGILANSLPAALNIYDEINKVARGSVFVLICPLDHQPNDLLRHGARLIFRRGRWKSLRLTLAGKVVYLRKALDHPQTIARLRKLNLDLGLHKSGNIYRHATISSFRLGILNAHIGLLPKYRGRSVMEWTLLQGDAIGISVFFVDEGIDTGQQLVLSQEIDISHCDSIDEAKQYLFNQDAQFYRHAIERLNVADVTYQTIDENGRRFFVMSELFRDVAEKCLAIRSPKSEIQNK